MRFVVKKTDCLRAVHDDDGSVQRPVQDLHTEVREPEAALRSVAS